MRTSLSLMMVLMVAAPAAARGRAELGGDWPAQASGKRVTLDAKTPNQALREIAAAAGWGLALNSGPAGESSVEFSFKDVPAEDALAAVLYASKLHATRIGDSVAVTPKGESWEDGESEASGTVSGTAMDGGFQTFVPSYQKNLDHRRRWRHKSGKDRVEIGHDIDIPAGAQVGDVVAVGGSIHVGAGASTNDLVAIGGRVDAEPGAQIAGDAVAIGGGEHFGSGASVSGDTVTLGGAAELDPGANISGSQVNLGLSHFSLGPPALFAGGLFILFWVRKLAEFVLFFCLGALLLLAAPTQLATIESFVVRQPLRAGLAGFLMTLAIPVLTLLLVVTVLGIPLVAVEFFGVALAAVMGFTALSVLIGNRLRVPVRGGGLLGLAVGTAIVIALTTLPWIGILILVVGWFLALGAALVTRFGSTP